MKPLIKDIENIQFQEPKIVQLDNGIPLHIINAGEQPVLKIEFIYFAGRPYEKKQLSARVTGSMIKEETESYSSTAVDELIDFHGATISTPINLDSTSIILYTISKHLATLLPLVVEMLTVPTFPEKELSILKDRSIETLKIELARVDTVAYRMITEQIFGSTHPYGYNSNVEKYSSMNTGDCRLHFRENIKERQPHIVISGKVETDHIKLINKALGGKSFRPQTPIQSLPSEPIEPFHTKIDIEGYQSAIRIGRRMFNRTHPDYFGFSVLNIILGGYFGSRLMTNIREEKGYTYNISSMMDPMIHDGYWCIGTEVATKYVGKTIDEIHYELGVLQKESISEEELKMVKNYLLGRILSSLDGPFKKAELVKSLLINNLTIDHYYRYIETIRNISPDQIKALAQKYFRIEDMHQVIVGSKA